MADNQQLPPVASPGDTGIRLWIRQAATIWNNLIKRAQDAADAAEAAAQSAQTSADAAQAEGEGAREIADQALVSAREARIVTRKADPAIDQSMRLMAMISALEGRIKALEMRSSIQTIQKKSLDHQRQEKAMIASLAKRISDIEKEVA